jgi:hypothetical protein
MDWIHPRKDDEKRDKRDKRDKKEPLPYNAFDMYESLPSKEVVYKERVVYKEKIIYRERPQNNSDEGQPNIIRLEAKEDIETENENERCVSCLSNKKCVLYSPCNHMVCCNECSRTIISATNKCPICRRNIKQMVNVFM